VSLDGAGLPPRVSERHLGAVQVTGDLRAACC